MIAERAPRPTVQGVSEPARGPVRVDPRGADPGRDARRRSTSATRGSHARSPAPRSGSPSIASQVGQSIEHAKLYAQARRRVEARGLRADLRGGLGVAVPRGVARGDREDDGRVARAPRRGRPRGRADRLARGARRSARVRLPLRWRGRTIGELVVDRDTPFRTMTASSLTRSRTRPRSRSSTDGWRCAASSPRRSTTASRTISRPSPPPPAAGTSRGRRPERRSGTPSTGSSRSRPSRGADGAPRGRRRPRRASTGCARCSSRGSSPGRP